MPILKHLNYFLRLCYSPKSFHLNMNNFVKFQLCKCFSFVGYQQLRFNSQVSNSRISAIKDAPKLDQFLRESKSNHITANRSGDTQSDESYLSPSDVSGNDRKVFIEVYGCQMNVNDTELVYSILLKNGFRKTDSIDDADIILLQTCAIRDSAEQKVWARLRELRQLKRTRKHVKLGLLGCMAERLRERIVEREHVVDVVCGPDAYRHLPLLLATAAPGNPGINVQLSLEETYAEITPVRLNPDSPSAYVSIMRGCDNMCAFCIVPFTRGRERSRPLESILEQIRKLVDQGVKEVTLLGQNVNSYVDNSEVSNIAGGAIPDSSEPAAKSPESAAATQQRSRGFSAVYRQKRGVRRFAQLLDAVARISPELRVRFTSPHPKDFPDEVLDVIGAHANVCKSLHLPAQSGSSAVLERMRRGYSRDAYLELVAHIRRRLPGVALTSDFIAGFCGETDAEHAESISLLEQVNYNFIYSFPFSLREKTRAYHRLVDDVPLEVKKRRHEQIQTVFRQRVLGVNRAFIGSLQLVLVEGDSKRSTDDLWGRCDANIKVICPKLPVARLERAARTRTDSTVTTAVPQVGDYLLVQITDASSQVLKGTPLCTTTLAHWAHSQTKRKSKCQAPALNQTSQ